MIEEDHTQKIGGYQGEIKRIPDLLNGGDMAPSKFPLHRTGEPSIKHGGKKIGEE
jgi:hypothetical protein